MFLCVYFSLLIIYNLLLFHDTDTIHFYFCTAMDKSKYYGADVFEKYYQAIISSLPMKDVTFLAELQRRYLLFDHIRTVLQSLSTSKEMASYLVDNVIKPGLNNDIMNTFDKLLLVMEGSSFDNVSKLGTVVNKELTAGKNTCQVTTHVKLALINYELNKFNSNSQLK